jgi:hypothetical protein
MDVLVAFKLNLGGWLMSGRGNLYADYIPNPGKFSDPTLLVDYRWPHGEQFLDSRAWFLRDQIGDILIWN